METEKKESAVVVLGDIERLEIGEIYVRKTNKGRQVIEYVREPLTEKQKRAAITGATGLGKEVETVVGIIPPDPYKLLTK